MTPLMRPEYLAPGLEFAGHFIVALLFAFWLLTRYVDDPDEQSRAERLPLADRASSPENLALVNLRGPFDQQDPQIDAVRSKPRWSPTTITLTAVALAGLVLPLLTMGIATRAVHPSPVGRSAAAAQRTPAPEAQE